MTVVREFENDDYLPEYGLIVLRDPSPGDDLQPPRESGDGEEPTGTFAAAGRGWLTCRAGDGHHVVRLELHDGPPPADQAGFDDVVETPYAAGSGGLSLTYLTGGAGPVDLDLDGAGRFRVRVSRRRRDTPDGAGDRWLLRFWPEPVPAPPAWLVRSRPAVGPGYTGWQSELQYEPMELAGVVAAAARERGGPVTVADVDAWCQAHHRPAGWLDVPLWQPPRAPLTTGHADLDQRKAAQHEEVVARLAGQQRRLDEIAAELGVPPVRSRRDALPLLAAAGILTGSAAAGYQPGQPARVDTVLSLPPDRVRSLEQQDARYRYGDLAEDLRSVLRWAPGEPYEVAAAELAGRLLVSEGELRAGVAFAEQSGVLHADGVETLRLRLGRRPAPDPSPSPVPGPSGGPPSASRPAAAPPASRPAAAPASGARPSAPPPPVAPPAAPRPAAAPRSGTRPSAPPPPVAPPAAPRPPGRDKSGAFLRPGLARLTVNTTAGPRLSMGGPRQERQEPPQPPFGAPPIAGMIAGDGTVVEWRDGVRVELTQLEPGQRRARALRTACGVLVLGHDMPAQLISADGETTEIGELRGPVPVLLGDGRRVAVVDSAHHRLESRYRLRVIDLTGGPAETMPWPEDRSVGLLGAYRDTLYFRDQQDHAIMRWTPGSAPERHPDTLDQIDPLTGTGLARTMGGVRVARPGGSAVTVPVDTRARLAPGGEQLWTTRVEPAALTLFPVRPGPDVRPQVWWLPERGRRGPHGAYGEPVWEDRDHVLFGFQPWHFPPEPATGVRLSIRDGAVERLPESGRPGQSVIFVEPLLTA
ncbi:hypothetical protein [Actinoplanes aureus]|uniref:Uncharacterized protein n=1 Tax=Actinoplanes aureus TaxID=2792083 RepID=A0A931CES6_9ACTN|nr:hypothetical protein [Actinoplanes aureus]MBG0565853.1 hypothetical protein [Actinoplanes aureus]